MVNSPELKTLEELAYLYLTEAKTNISFKYWWEMEERFGVDARNNTILLMRDVVRAVTS